MLERNDELINLFNKEEQNRQRLQLRKKARRKRAPHASKKLRKLLDLLDEAMERRKPVDCFSRKWVKPPSEPEPKPKGPIGFQP